ncbi:CDI toxin immunity protein [Pseudoneobacillus sp. C159]
MDKKDRQRKLAQKLTDLKFKQERELYINLADEYCEQLIDKNSINVLDELESEKIYTELSNFFPFDFSGSGRITWSQLKETLYVKNEEELSSFIKRNKYEGSQVFLLRKFSITINTSPVIVTSIENVVASLENLLDEEQFIFCPSKGFVIDIPFSSNITVGIK